MMLLWLRHSSWFLMPRMGSFGSPQLCQTQTGQGPRMSVHCRQHLQRNPKHFFKALRYIFWWGSKYVSSLFDNLKLCYFYCFWGMGADGRCAIFYKFFLLWMLHASHLHLISGYTLGCVIVWQRSFVPWIFAWMDKSSTNFVVDSSDVKKTVQLKSAGMFIANKIMYCIALLYDTLRPH